MKLPFLLPVPDHLRIHGDTVRWTGHAFEVGEASFGVLEYSINTAGWTDALTDLHEAEAGSRHPIDEASRADALFQLKRSVTGVHPVVLEVGCSSGYLLRHLQRDWPKAQLVGADVVHGPLLNLAQSGIGVPLLRFDLLQCPLPDGAIDAMVLLNVLEHIEDDAAAARQIARLLKPGGVAVVEVPAGSSLFDAYDRKLMHFRRYDLKELVELFEAAGLTVERRSHLGFLVYPAFWWVKRRNKRRLEGLSSQEQDAAIEGQIRSTGKSWILRLAFEIERWVGRWLSFPVGIRCQVTVRRKVGRGP